MCWGIPNSHHTTPHTQSHAILWPIPSLPNGGFHPPDGAGPHGNWCSHAPSDQWSGLRPWEERCWSCPPRPLSLILSHHAAGSRTESRVSAQSPRLPLCDHQRYRRRSKPRRICLRTSTRLSRQRPMSAVASVPTCPVAFVPLLGDGVFHMLGSLIQFH